MCNISDEPDICVASIALLVNSKKRTFLFRGNGKNLQVHTGALCLLCRKHPEAFN